MSQESTEKIIDYLARVSKEPITVDGVAYHIPPPDAVTLDASFFIKDDCVMCGKCCPNETTVWTESGYEGLFEIEREEFLRFGLDFSDLTVLIHRIETQWHNINGEPVAFYVSAADDEKVANKLSWADRAEVSRCHWLFEKDGTHRCKIHPARSVTCGLPHIRFFNRNLHTVIRTGQFGRNWRLKCPVAFEQVVDRRSLNVKIYWLIQLLKVAKDLGVDTYLPEIVQYLTAGNTKPKNFIKDIKPKLFKGVDYGTAESKTAYTFPSGRTGRLSTILCGEPEQGSGDVPTGERRESSSEPAD